MKKVRVECDAVLEVYIEDDVSNDEAERMAKEIADGQIRKLDECESGVHDPDLCLTSWAMVVLDCEEVDCE